MKRRNALLTVKRGLTEIDYDGGFLVGESFGMCNRGRWSFGDRRHASREIPTPRARAKERAIPLRQLGAIDGVLLRLNARIVGTSVRQLFRDLGTVQEVVLDLEADERCKSRQVRQCLEEVVICENQPESLDAAERVWEGRQVILVNHQRRQWQPSDFLGERCEVVSREIQRCEVREVPDRGADPGQRRVRVDVDSGEE